MLQFGFHEMRQQSVLNVHSNGVIPGVEGIGVNAFTQLPKP
jgi:hypothetical protein